LKINFDFNFLLRSDSAII